MSTGQTAYDVTVVGGGHNGLTAAAYLARAGLSVLVLERLGQVGGAAVSRAAFRGHPARVSPYADLVSLLPDALLADLDLDLALTPLPGFRSLPDDHAEQAEWQAFLSDVRRLTGPLAPTLLEPLPTERAVREHVDEQTWTDLVSRPLGEALERRFADDAVRGLLAVDALAGTSTSLHDPALVANRGFLYQRLGEAHGGWRVPVGGMGAVTHALARSATAAGAELVTSAGVSRIAAGDDGAEVTWHDGQREHTVQSRHVLASVAPWVLRILMGDSEDADTKPQGAQLRVDLLLERLPRLRSGADPASLFAGGLHVGCGLTQLEAAYAEAAAGRIPDPFPLEARCASLTDPSVLGEVPAGMHTLSLRGFHVPAALFEDDRDARRGEAVDRALAALDEHLAEPITAVVATDADGRHCLEARVPQDVEAELAMPGGHPFHGDLDWPWASNRARLDTPAQQWGVQTDAGSVLVCGSGARRGGGVSGIGGHNAAQAVLASR